MQGKHIGEIELGEKSQFTKTVSESDVYAFAGISGDFNPAHLNNAQTKKLHVGTNDRPELLNLSFGPKGRSARGWLFKGSTRVNTRAIRG